MISIWVALPLIAAGVCLGTVAASALMEDDPDEEVVRDVRITLLIIGGVALLAALAVRAWWT